MLADQFPTTSTIFRSNPACDRRPAMSLLWAMWISGRLSKRWTQGP
jgi:hypothetical protein